MALNIDKLRLTHEERTEAFVGDGLGATERIADAQLAKALWGLLDWLEASHANNRISTNSRQLRDTIWVASISRP